MEAESFGWVTRYYELFKIGWCLTMNSFVGEDKDFNFYSEFNLEMVQRSQYGGNMISDAVSYQYMHSCDLD